MWQSGGCSHDQERQKKSYIRARHHKQRQKKCKMPEASKEKEACSRTPCIGYKANISLPKDILDLLLTFHVPVCCQEVPGNPRYSLYWAYDKAALKEILGMTKEQFRNVESSMGRFMRRVPKNSHWWSRLKGVDGPAWALRSGLVQNPP